MTVRIPVVMMCSSDGRGRVLHLSDTRRPGDVTGMSGNDVLAARFEEHRGRLTAVATRLLGSRAEAEDAVQEAWLRVSRAGTAAVLDDSVGLALLVVLDQLAPAERLAFVLHDLFDVPFDEIAPIVDRSPTAARQLASRARRRVRGAELPDDPERRREVVAAFLDASRNGDFSALLELLHPEAVLRADAVATRMGSEAEVRGATAAAPVLSRRAPAARLVLVDGVPGAVWSHRGTPQVVFAVTVEDGVVTAVDLLA